MSQFSTLCSSLFVPGGCLRVLLILPVLRLLGTSLFQGDFTCHIEHLVDDFGLSELEFGVQHPLSTSTFKASDYYVLTNSLDIIIRILEALQIRQEHLAFSLFDVDEVPSRLGNYPNSTELI